jgi:hypothetical protein
MVGGAATADIGHPSIQECRQFADSAPVKRARTTVQKLLEKSGLGGASQHPAIEAAIERHEAAKPEPIVGREWHVEASLAVVSLAGAVALALFAPDTRSLNVPLLFALLAAFVLACRITFYDGGGYTTPIQLVLVPMLLLLPPHLVPILAIAGVTIRNLPRFARRELHPQRVAIGAGDALFALGPALVLSLAGPEQAAWSAWPIYLAAIGAQFACDFAASASRDFLVVGLGADLHLPLVAWTWAVDGMLSSIGLMAAIAARDEPFAVLLVIPVMGLLAVFSRERDARINQSLELSRAYRGTTLLLSDVLDGDDEYTAFHSRGVVQLSIAVADHLGLDERQKRNVEFGALLHDVGKIAIPKEILNKPGKLTQDEWVVMETHTLEGQKLLDRVGGVLGEVGQIVRSSHERWDGGGYPDGLAGGQIPVEATIVAVCDAFNAMTTHRPYRQALSLERAVAELVDNRGTQFSPAVVDALILLIAEDEAMVGPAAPGRDPELDEITLVVPQPLPKPAA